jgi:MSHA biogenesis protein MshL
MSDSMKSDTVLDTVFTVSRIGVYVAVALGAVACSSLRPFGQEKEFRARLKVPDITAPNQSAPQTTLPIERLPSDTFWVRPQSSEGELPNRRVENLSVTERGLFDVLQIIFSSTSMPLSFEGGADAASRYGVVTLNNLSGTLPQVMNKLGEIMGFFWTVTESGVLRIMPEQQFVVTMPPVLNEDSMAGITNTMQFLGAKDVYLDRINRSLVFRANRRALSDIQNYLERARATRSLIVYDMNVLQVDLNDSNNMGIRWELYKSGGGINTAQDSGIVGAASTADRVTQIARSSSGIETLIFGENFSTNFLIDFLKSQGDVKTLSQPKIGLMNGTNGNIRVGQSTTFVSRVGSQIVNGVAQSTADTQNLRTGLEVSLTGEAHDATIYTRINISITELLALKRFTALGVDLNLPEVADRELKTQVRCRPGDTILLGGITVSRAQDDFQSGLGVRSRSESTKQTELVVTIRPRLLMFDTVARVQEPASRKTSSPEPDPVANIPAQQGTMARTENRLRLSTSLGVIPARIEVATKMPVLKEK